MRRVGIEEEVETRFAKKVFFINELKSIVTILADATHLAYLFFAFATLATMHLAYKANRFLEAATLVFALIVLTGKKED